MLRQLLHKYLHHRHPWRIGKFNELNEIYVVMLVRGMSLSMMGIFIPIFMYKSGYVLQDIILLLVFYFLTRVYSDILTAFLIARFGPKHILFLGQMLFLVTSLMFLTLNSVSWPLFLVGSVWGLSQSLFFLSFDVDFSKIKHSAHSGKELGYVLIMSKIGAFLGPLLGGLVGYFFGAEYIFAFSSVVMTLGLIPLFKTSEPVHTHQKLDYKSFDVKKIYSLMPAFFGVHIENTVSVMLWPLFLAIFVIIGNTVFVKIGLITSVSIGISVLTSLYIGKLVDGRHGRVVLRISAVSNTLLHWARAFVATYIVAFGVNIINEVVTIGFRLPFYKGYFDEADDYPGHRIVFLSIMESFASFAKLVLYCLLFVVANLFSERTTLNTAFVIAGFASLLILTEKLKSLTYNKHNG